MTEINHEIRTLNNLIAHICDNIDGYAAAAGDPQAGSLAEMFRARVRERGTVVRDLQAEVARLGGVPEEHGTLLAAAHRTYLHLKAAVTRTDLQAVVEEVERSENLLKAKFESALADEDLSFSVRSVIRTGFASVGEGREEMRELKHSLEAA